MSSPCNTCPRNRIAPHCRDPRATKNAIYHPESVRVLLRLAEAHGVPLLFVTNNVCNKLLKFQDAAEVAERMALQGLLRRIGDVWFGLPHLQGGCSTGCGMCIGVCVGVWVSALLWVGVRVCACSRGVGGGGRVTRPAAPAGWVRRSCALGQAETACVGRR